MQFVESWIDVVLYTLQCILSFLINNYINHHGMVRAPAFRFVSIIHTYTHSYLVSRCLIN